ncbi:hypothetical protein [Mycobacterium aquaticum]|uniref:hypothetical protein n=1 Tax=Mycobacterium aquaticum TaxID=1927124 RepID=UPI00147523C7|nr:hypothetical protein [Mycobacterium aquaticum]
MRICKHCGVRIELIECADGHDRWMHKVQRYSPPIPPSLYLECDLPRTVAEP